MRAFVIDKALFFLREPRCFVREQRVPARAAGEEFGVPPDRAGFDDIAFGGDISGRIFRKRLRMQ